MILFVRFLIFFGIYLCFDSILFSKSTFFKGQLWISGLTSDDVPSDYYSIESNIGYIPTFSFFRKLNNNQLLDVEMSYKLNQMYSGDSLIINYNHFYRYWLRYSSNKFEARLGLQKIVFGPSQILRSLSWFDNIDLKDPIGQIKGVKALRLRWFPSNSLSFWSWFINGDEDKLSFGGRGELSTKMGEWGFSFHQDPSKYNLFIDQINFPILFGQYYSIGSDYRYDGLIGFWIENSITNANNIDFMTISFGADYTLPISNGILITSEHMLSSIQSDHFSINNTVTALMANMPIGMIHHITLISQIDWDNNRNYNHLQWSSTYDYYSINFILSINPKRKDYQELLLSSNTLGGFGLGIQCMFIYNH